jgi:hypothetical protein
VPVTKIADLDAVARIRKRDRIVFHTTDVPQMFAPGKVSTKRQACLPASELSWFYASYGAPSAPSPVLWTLKRA